MINGTERAEEEMLWKMAARRPEVWLQPSDWKWLSALEVYGILGVGQLIGLALKRGSNPRDVVRMFFNGIRRKEHWLGRAKRARKLAREGYLRRQEFPCHPPVFTLTEKSHELLREVGLSRLPGFRHRISEAMVAHELTVAGVGLVLSELLGLEVLLARERIEWKGRGGRPATDSRLVPDLWIADDFEPKGVEVERGQKAKEEYRERWHSMRLLLPENGRLLYLTLRPGGRRFILELAEDYRADFVLVAEHRDFIQAAGRCRFFGYQPGKSLLVEPRPVMSSGCTPDLAQSLRTCMTANSSQPKLVISDRSVPAFGPALRTTGGMDQ